MCPRTARPTERRASCRVWTRNEAKSYSAHESAGFSRFPHIRSGHHPRRRPPWPRPCAPSPSRSLAAHRPQLPWPPPAVPGPRRCAGGIAPSRPSQPPAALRRRGSSTTVGTPLPLLSRAPFERLYFSDLAVLLLEEGGSGPGRRLVLVAGAAAAAAFISRPNPAACELPFEFTTAFKCLPSAVPTLLVTFHFEYGLFGQN